MGGVAYAILLTIKAHEFVTHGTQTYVQANNLVGSTGFAALQYAGLIGSLLLAIAFVLVSMNAMRVGLLTKFLGYLGMAAAAASLFLIGSAPALLIEVFWLLAVDGKPTAEVAAGVSLAVKTIYQIKCRVLKDIRVEVDRLKTEGFGEA